VAGVEIDRFEADAAGQAILSTRFTIRPIGGGPVREDQMDAGLPPSGPGQAPWCWR